MLLGLHNDKDSPSIPFHNNLFNSCTISRILFNTNIAGSIQQSCPFVKV